MDQTTADLSDNTGLEFEAKPEIKDVSLKASNNKPLIIGLISGGIVILIFAIGVIVFLNSNNNQTSTDNISTSLSPTPEQLTTAVPVPTSAEANPYLKDKVCFEYRDAYYCTDKNGDNIEKIIDNFRPSENQGAKNYDSVIWVDDYILYLDNGKLIAQNPKSKEIRTLFSDARLVASTFSCNSLESCVIEVIDTESSPVKSQLIIKNSKTTIPLKFNYLYGMGSFNFEYSSSGMIFNPSASKFIYFATDFENMNGKDCPFNPGVGGLIISDLAGNITTIAQCEKIATPFWKDDNNIIFQRISDSKSVKLVEYNIQTKTEKLIKESDEIKLNAYLDKQQIINANFSNPILYYTYNSTKETTNLLEHLDYAVYSYDFALNKDTILIDKAYPIGLVGNDALLVGLFRKCPNKDKCQYANWGSIEIYDYKIINKGVVIGTKFIESLKKVTSAKGDRYDIAISRVNSAYQPADSINRIVFFQGLD